MSVKLNIGVIGAGRIAQVRCKNLALNVPGAKLLMISDIILDAANDCARQYNIPEVTQDYRKIIENPRIDAIIVCSSTDTHSEIIQEAAAAGKHIFCEKPFDVDLNKIDRAIEAVKKSGIKLHIGFQRRFDPDFQKARQLILEGKIGTPNVFKLVSRDPAPPSLEYLKRSGGIFTDSAIHDFDMARFLSGNEVEEVYATGGVCVNQVCREAEDIDTAITILKFNNGTFAIIENARSTTYGYDQRIEVFGSGGMINVGNKIIDTVELTDGESTKKSLLPHFFLERYANAFINELKAFIRCITEDLEPPVTGKDGKAPMVIALAARKSLENNRPVKISEI